MCILSMNITWVSEIVNIVVFLQSPDWFRSWNVRGHGRVNPFYLWYLSRPVNAHGANWTFGKWTCKIQENSGGYWRSGDDLKKLENLSSRRKVHMYVIMNAYIYISCNHLLNFFSAVTAKPNLWKIQLNFGKPLLEQYSYQNVSWN